MIIGNAGDSACVYRNNFLGQKVYRDQQFVWSTDTEISSVNQSINFFRSILVLKYELSITNGAQLVINWSTIELLRAEANGEGSSLKWKPVAVNVITLFIRCYCTCYASNEVKTISLLFSAVFLFSGICRVNYFVNQSDYSKISMSEGSCPYPRIL